mmetsp:Transcript_11073/g.25635  ORF Transcript_11073/g.25635 Transcript_11073/m.25635 type:complete len:271 (-) Transcript_11073:199-1011(-)
MLFSCKPSRPSFTLADHCRAHIVSSFPVIPRFRSPDRRHQDEKSERCLRTISFPCHWRTARQPSTISGDIPRMLVLPRHTAATAPSAAPFHPSSPGGFPGTIAPEATRDATSEPHSRWKASIAVRHASHPACTIQLHRARDESRFCELCADPLEDSVGCRGAVERLGIVSLLEPEEGRESGDTEPQLQERCRFVILLVKIEERKEHCLPANPLHALKLLGSPLEVGACLAALAAPRRSEHHQDVSVRLHRCFQRGRINHPDSFRICGRRC